MKTTTKTNAQIGVTSAVEADRADGGHDNCHAQRDWNEQHDDMLGPIQQRLLLFLRLISCLPLLTLPTWPWRSHTPRRGLHVEWRWHTLWPAGRTVWVTDDHLCVHHAAASVPMQRLAWFIIIFHLQTFKVSETWVSTDSTVIQENV